jgi:hypothetical protein
MRANATERAISATGPEAERNASSPLVQLEPSHVRVVALVIKRTGRVVQHDCYDPDGRDADMRNLMQFKEGTLWLRTIDWARSKSMDADVHVRWTSMGVTTEEVGRVSIFRWPRKEPIRVFTALD